MKVHGIMLIEVMIVVAIVAFLAVIAVPNYLKFVARAKRAEAQLNLVALYAAQKVYWSEHGTYTNVLHGANSIDWEPEGKNQYTYGFAGSDGVNYIHGALPADLSALSQARADNQGFVAVAIADIDGDGKSDVVIITDKKVITITQDDLA